ncbi:hypothetical protein BV25DRAFT_1440656 [Artomyces pyxidatus]|uniref:Uncharacterized protein n=1 Tax=Artomyces pyxidatus TaxID=48021 RepID=A0ACB8SM29_9AGAM|nr:hypothetical protein BV25DRAFT_1440656 [Artomyces pyxidatus]
MNIIDTACYSFHTYSRLLRQIFHGTTVNDFARGALAFCRRLFATTHPPCNRVGVLLTPYAASPRPVARASGICGISRASSTVRPAPPSQVVCTSISISRRCAVPGSSSGDCVPSRSRRGSALRGLRRYPCRVSHALSRRLARRGDAIIQV